MHEFTSIAYWFVSIYAQGTWAGPAFSLLMASSILNHSKPKTHPHKWLVQRLDRCVAHAVTIGTIIDAWHVAWTPARKPYLYVYQLGLWWTILVYRVFRWSFLPNKLWHASVHVISTIGAMALHHAKMHV